MLKFGITMTFADTEDFCVLAQTAEEAGFAAVSLSDHLIYPQKLSVPYPYTEDGVPGFTDADPFPDPWISFAAMAVVTSTIKFYTSVFVLPARNPFHMAKILATLSLISNERVGLGAGVGWMLDEFKVSGEQFEHRGPRTDEMIEVMRKLWTGEQVEHHGRFYDFPLTRQSPAPREQIPVYTGGYSDLALKRAARHDGWISDLHMLGDMEVLLQKIDAYRKEYGRENEPHEKLCFACLDVDGPGDYRRMEDMGADMATTMPWVRYGVDLNGPLQDRLDGIRRFGGKSVV